jgi:hypothetical protein
VSFNTFKLSSIRGIMYLRFCVKHFKIAVRCSQCLLKGFIEPVKPHDRFVKGGYIQKKTGDVSNGHLIFKRH